MSIIRCLSNPEGLYILQDRKGIFISYSGSGFCEHVPPKDWYALVRRYESLYGDLPNAGIRRGCLRLEWTPEFKYRLVTPTRATEIWPVTWEYIVNSTRQHLQLIGRGRTRKKPPS